MAFTREILMRWRCRRIEACLVELAEGTATGKRRRRIERHVAGCARCADALADLREIPAELRGLKTPDRGDAFWLGQRNQIMASLPGAPPAGSRAAVPRLRRGWQAALAPVAAGLVAVAGYWLLHTPSAPHRRTMWEPGEGGDQMAIALLDVSASLFPEESVLPPMEASDGALWCSLAARGWGGEIAEPPDMQTLTDDEIETIENLWG
jgi:hypothetical protein